MQPLLEQPVCVVDVETFSPGSGRHELIDVAALLIDIDGRPVRGHLNRDGRSAGRGAPVMFQELCRPSSLPPSWRGVRLRNAVDPRLLYQSHIRDEATVARDFAEWHFGCALNAPLIAWNNGFDRSALAGALKLSGDDGDLPWGRCLMLNATEHLMLRRSDGRVRRKAPKDEVAQLLFGPDGYHKAMQYLAKQVQWSGPMDLHLALPDVLLEAAILIELHHRAQPT